MIIISPFHDERVSTFAHNNDRYFIASPQEYIRTLINYTVTSSISHCLFIYITQNNRRPDELLISNSLMFVNVKLLPQTWHSDKCNLFTGNQLINYKAKIKDIRNTQKFHVFVIHDKKKTKLLMRFIYLFNYS